MLKDAMKKAMAEAIDRNENVFSNGDINWNFVDADVYADVEKLVTDQNEYMVIFDELAFEFKKAEIESFMNVHMRQATAHLH
jgi:hypothetical protein